MKPDESYELMVLKELNFYGGIRDNEFEFQTPKGAKVIKRTKFPP